MIAKKPPAILLYTELFVTDFKRLTDAELGKIVRALYDFIDAGEIKNETYFNSDRAVLGAYDRSISMQMQNVSRYAENCKRNSYNAYVRNHPDYKGTFDEYVNTVYPSIHRDDTATACERTEPHTTACERTEPHAKSANSNSKSNTKGMGNNKSIYHRDEQELPFA